MGSTQIAFVQGQDKASPADDNECPLPPIVINELNILRPTNGTREFLEIKSIGLSYFPVDKLAVVSF